MKIKEILKIGIEELKKENIEEYSIKAKIILSEILKKNKEYLIIYDEEEVSIENCNIFFKHIERLKNNEPLQYIINKQEFMGYNFYVDKNVLIPQPDTEILVEETILVSKNIIKENDEKLSILDLCTGSGAIAISLSKLIKKSLLFASDISEEALKIAKRNAISNDTNIEFIESDLFDRISRKNKFDIIVSNPPYIETEVIKELSKEVQEEPLLALDGGADGLDFYKKITIDAKEYLKRNGFLIFEIGYNQKEQVEKILKENGYKNIYSRKDLAGNNRVVIGQI